MFIQPNSLGLWGGIIGGFFIIILGVAGGYSWHKAFRYELDKIGDEIIDKFFQR